MKRHRVLRGAVFGGAFAIAAAALAFFLTTWLAEGEHSGLTGSSEAVSTLPIEVDFLDGVRPGARKKVTANLDKNAVNGTVEFQELAATISTPAFPQCGNEWLTLTAETNTGSPAPALQEVLDTGSSGSAPLTYSGGTANLWEIGGLANPSVYLEFRASKESVDETACEAVPVTVHLELVEGAEL